MRFLLVEDEPKMARALRQGLERLGHVVDIATDGSQGLSLAVANGYDAVILDVMLPGRDGYAVCREMRAHGRWAPVLMLTARDAVEDRVRGLDAGADDYLVKPFAFDELTARLRALVRRGPNERPTVLRQGTIELDPAAHIVTCDGAPIGLSAKEFALLEFLMRHPGQVMTRGRLLEHVWDYRGSSGSNVVDVYVGYLRRKLGDDGGETIRTVRGVGYAIGPSS
jgi:two-component system OmpR family response regulator